MTMQPINEIINQSAPNASPSGAAASPSGPAEFDRDTVIGTVRSLGIKGDIRTTPAVVTGQYHTYRVRFSHQKGEPAEKMALVEKSGLFAIVVTGPDWMEVGPKDLPADVLADLRRQSPPDTATDDAAVLRRVTGHIRLKLSSLHAGLMDSVKPAPALGVYSVTMINKIPKTLIAQLIPASGLIFVSANPDDPYTMRLRIPEDMYTSLGIAPVKVEVPDEADPVDETPAAKPRTSIHTKPDSYWMLPQQPADVKRGAMVYATKDIHADGKIIVPEEASGFIVTFGKRACNVKFDNHPHTVLCTWDMLLVSSPGVQPVEILAPPVADPPRIVESINSPGSRVIPTAQPGDALPPSERNEHADDGTFTDPIETDANDDLDEEIRPDLEEQLGVVQAALESERSLRALNLQTIKELDEAVVEMSKTHAAEVAALRHELANAQMLNQLQFDMLREAAAPKPSTVYPTEFWFNTIIDTSFGVIEIQELVELRQNYDFLFPATTPHIGGQIAFSAYLVRKPSIAPRPEAAQATVTDDPPQPMIEKVGASITYIIPPTPEEAAFANTLTGQFAAGATPAQIKDDMNADAMQQARQAMKPFARSSRPAFASVGVHEL